MKVLIFYTVPDEEWGSVFIEADSKEEAWSKFRQGPRGKEVVEAVVMDYADVAHFVRDWREM